MILRYDARTDRYDVNGEWISGQAVTALRHWIADEVRQGMMSAIAIGKDKSGVTKKSNVDALIAGRAKFYSTQHKK